MSSEWVPMMATGLVSADEPGVGIAHGEEVAVFQVGEEYFATSNFCTHGLMQLSDGYLEGFLIECPLHQGLFDVRNGKCAGGPVFVDLVSYEVRVAGGIIEVRPRG